MSEQEQATDLISVTVNGIETRTKPGRLLIDVAEELDIFVPRFCYHPGLESVAACRMCLVQVEGSRRPLDPACATQVTDGMVVNTQSPAATEAQDAVLELLLINHPLDCPICDRGGECPLQDQTLKFGPGRSRYNEEKRHYKKALPISELVVLDRERCVLCWRCVRFSEEVAGDPFIDLMDRGSHTQINTATDKPFDSYFSGNTIQICPVGALTSTSYRFLSRPWDLDGAQSTCSFCAVGCPISLEHRAGEVLRAQALPNENVNGFWSCDKGRFGHRYVSHPERLKSPLVRKKDASSEVSFGETTWDWALDLVAERLKKTIAEHGPSAVGFIGGSHATNEDLFAVSRFFRELVGTPNLDVRTFDSAFPYGLLAHNGVVGSTATINDLDEADTILWIGPDPKEELPVLFLRLKKAVEAGRNLVVIHPRRISLSRFGTHIHASPGQQNQVLTAIVSGNIRDDVAGADRLHAAHDAIKGKRVVVALGQQFVGTVMTDVVQTVSHALSSSDSLSLLMLVPNANTQGAIDMGIFPGLGPGHRPAADGMDATAMLRAAVSGELKMLWVMGADLVTDFPDGQLAHQALTSQAFVVVSELFPTMTARLADVVLPAAAFAEKEGAFTNLERRLQKVNPAVPAPGVARSDLRIFSDLGSRLRDGWGWATSADAAADIAAQVPTHPGVDWSSLGEEEIPKPVIGTAGESLGAGWPLSWELRAVDATRRAGAVWSGEGAARVQDGASHIAFDPPAGFPLMLLAARSIYDGGQMVSRSGELRAVTPDPYVEIHPDEALARRLTDGERVTVTSPRGSVQVALKVSNDTPRGAAFMLFDQPGVQVNALIDMSGPATFVEIAL